MASQDQGKVTRSATEIQPLLTGLRRKRQHQLTFPLTMKAEAEPVIQPVVTGCSVVEQLFNSVCITGLQSGRSPSVITMTVAMPTAAEHTMQPASINENSPWSMADCISCKAQATRAITTNTSAIPSGSTQFDGING